MIFGFSEIAWSGEKVNWIFVDQNNFRVHYFLRPNCYLVEDFIGKLECGSAQHSLFYNKVEIAIFWTTGYCKVDLRLSSSLKIKFLTFDLDEQYHNRP